MHYRQAQSHSPMAPVPFYFSPSPVISITSVWFLPFSLQWWLAGSHCDRADGGKSWTGAVSACHCSFLSRGGAYADWTVCRNGQHKTIYGAAIVIIQTKGIIKSTVMFKYTPFHLIHIAAVQLCTHQTALALHIIIDRLVPITVYRFADGMRGRIPASW